jgi:hypothetical protein
LPSIPLRTSPLVDTAFQRFSQVIESNGKLSAISI